MSLRVWAKRGVGSPRMESGVHEKQTAMNKAAQELGRLGGRAGTGKAKARTTEQARAAALARWAKRWPKKKARR